MSTDENNRHPDFELVADALLSPQCQDALMKRLYPRILQIARYVLKNQHFADDVAQNAAVEISKCFAKYQGLGSLESWAGQITFRIAAKESGANFRLQKVETTLSEEQMSENPTPEQNVAKYRLFQSMQEKMAHMPDKRRVPLLLHVAEGYTVQEVAEITSLTPDTVKYRLKTAYKELRNILEDNPALYRAMLEEIR